MDEKIYIENGYRNREDYLRRLASQYGVEFDLVEAVADMLGPNEDFDGLVVALEDAAGYFEGGGYY